MRLVNYEYEERRSPWKVSGSRQEGRLKDEYLEITVA